MKNDFVLHQVVGLGDNMSAPFLAQINETFFIRLVEHACWQLQRFVNSRSLAYVPSKSYVGDHFSGKKAAWYNLLPQIMVFDSAYKEYVAAWDMLVLIQEYVALKNQDPQKWHVGEQAYTPELVYLTLLYANNWTVNQIEDIHANHGKHFGSAGRDQKVSLFEPVKGWPALYKFADCSNQRLLLPIERQNLNLDQSDAQL